MEILLQRVFDGLSIGSVYALVALALVVVYAGTGHLNLAQGEMATLTTFGVWYLTDVGVPLVIAICIGMVLGFALGALTEVAIVRPLDHRSPTAVLVAVVSIFLGINALTAGVWGAQPDELIGSPFPSDPDDFVRIFGAAWRYEYIGTLLVALAACGGLFVLFRTTRFGLAMRGVANNAESAQLVGIRLGFVLAAAWGIAGALGSLAAALFASVNGQVTPTLMLSALVYGVAAATLGGLDSPHGAVIAALMIGVGENLLAGYFPEWIGQELKLAVALMAILAVLAVRPTGLFGTRVVERV